MRFTAPIIALAASLPLLTTAQMGPDDTICEFLYGTDYTDACCHTVISRGINAPCTDIEYVSNLTERGEGEGTRMDEEGREREREEKEPAYPTSGPLFGHGPSGIVSEYMTLEDLEQVYWDYFSSNAMGETMAKAVAAMKDA
ncbi:uncharacterized protein J4E84_007309 [Alternaria hordeiaustralica]|uniref:uncharacterized protein n=1 Tax=Alternaria hordeiaustralica TaxID=1187925 RepID=UPI0020C28430|nr:uncharacterized protein J4E84_007309 [Alternaria hordeiaustralica]KAI4681714.1 hypothetical protein J4E84_007309 [Alternaria hordeiaustralica]